MSLLYDAGNPKLVFCDKEPRGVGWGGREVEEGGDICIPVANSH